MGEEAREKITGVVIKVYEMAKGALGREPYDESVVRANTIRWAEEELCKLPKDKPPLLSDGDRIRTKYMTFVKVGQKPKTSEWHIVNKESGYVLGSIHWYGAWRQYIVETSECIFNYGCLDIISQFLTELNNKQKAQRLADIRWYEGE